MSITYVTALFNIYKNQDKVDLYTKYFNLLSQINIPIIVFVDDDFYNTIVPRTNVKIIKINLSETEIYPLCMQQHLKLPDTRCTKKDTQAYLALMNTKIEFVLKSEIKTPYVSWIDAGVLKLLKNNIKDFLEGFFPSTNTITMPGCWNSQSVDINRVCWRFAGTFWFAPTWIIPLFYKTCLEQINKYITNNTITWEVNTWADIENIHPYLFSWYKGDHNDELFNIPSSYFTQFKITKTNLDGLGNVLKGFISAYSINNNTKIECNPDYILGCYDSILDSQHIYNPDAGNNIEPFYTCRLLVLKNEENDQVKIENEYSNYLDGCGNRKLDYLFSFKTAIDWNYDKNKIAQPILNRILKTIGKIKFNSLILDKVNNTITQPSLGISVRTWTAKHEHNINRLYSFVVYKDAIIKELENKDIKTVVLSFDNNNVKEDYIQLLKEYPVDIVVMNKEEDVNDLQHAMIKMLTLSKCTSLICNRLSTFSELCFWFSGCQQHVIPLF